MIIRWNCANLMSSKHKPLLWLCGTIAAYVPPVKTGTFQCEVYYCLCSVFAGPVYFIVVVFFLCHYHFQEKGDVAIVAGLQRHVHSHSIKEEVLHNGLEE